jgi:hypothetical protein
VQEGKHEGAIEIIPIVHTQPPLPVLMPVLMLVLAVGWPAAPLFSCRRLA